MRFRLARGVEARRSDGGMFLVAERPLRAVALNEALYQRVAAGGSIAAREPAAVRALERLARAGYLEREPEAPASVPEGPRVTVIVPVLDRAAELARCLASLGRVRYPPERLDVIVVDDGSRDGSAAVARSHGARVVSSGGRGRGPAAARNRGAREAHGELLAFLDSDCTASPEWLAELVEGFADPEVAAVGGRVTGMLGRGGLDRYEERMSSLSLGSRERAGQAGDDTFYLPSCNLLVRREAFLAAGGFCEELHVGEDVDLTWRLRDRGLRILYVPRGAVCHAHRNRLGAFVRRRFEYGTSEALLQTRHPRRTKKLAVPPGLAAVLALTLAPLLGAGWGWLVAAAAVLAVDAARVRERFAQRGLRLAYGRVLAARARAGASLGYYLGYHLIRYYGWLLLLASLFAPRLGLVAAAVLAGVASVDRRVKDVALSWPRFVGFYVAEQLAYGAGVFWGCVRQGSFRSYRPRLLARMEMSFT